MRTMSKEQFEGSYAWKLKREKILRRDEGLCVECRRYGRKDRDGLPVRAALPGGVTVDGNPAIRFALDPEAVGDRKSVV